MLSAALVLVILSVTVALAAHVLSSLDWRTPQGEMPFLLSLPMAAGSFALVAWANVNLLSATVPTDSEGFLVAVFVATMLPPVLVFVRIMMDSLISGSVNSFHGWNASSSPIESDFSRASTLAMRNDVDGAVSAYQGYYAESPNDSRPLFRASEVWEMRRDYAKASAALRDIMQRFSRDDKVWGEAAYRLANLHEQTSSDHTMSDDLLRKITRRVPNSEIGYLSAERLANKVAPKSA